VAKLLEIQIPFIVANQGAYPMNDPVRDAQTGAAAHREAPQAARARANDKEQKLRQSRLRRRG
jgi:hypothetical protein